MSAKGQYDAAWWAVPLRICGEQKNTPMTKNKTILMRQPHARFATAGWNPYCKCTVANTKDEDLYVGEQPLTAGCDRRCWLLFYGSGKGASVGERPIREHFLTLNGENQ